MNVTVELDIFSGSPNPSWTLTPDESKKLMNLLDSLPEVPKKEPDDGLGYRGFILNLTSEKTDAPPRRVHIFNGIIAIDSGTKKYYRDLHGLEKWLLHHASSQGYGGIVGTEQ